MTHDIDLIGYLDGSLPGAEKDKIQSHLKTCTECSKQYKLLQKSELLFASIYRSQPELLCPDMDSLIQFVSGEISPAGKKSLEAHLKDCAPCGQKLAALKAASATQEEIPAQAQLNLLPEDIRTRIDGRKRAMRARLKEALLTLKSRGNQEISTILTEVEYLTERLLSVARERLPSYALERDITLPSQTDLELRGLPEEIDFTVELENHVLQIWQSPGGLRLRITREGLPVSGSKISWLNKAGNKTTAITDEKGEAFVGE